MNNEIIKFSTGKVIVDLSNVFFYLSFADEIVLNEKYSPDLLYSLRELFNPDADLVYERNDRICPHCGNIMTKNGKTQSVSINKNMDMKYQTYECKIENGGCGKFVSASAEQYKDKGSNYTNQVKEKGKKLSDISYLSYESKSEVMKEENGVEIHRSTVYRHEADKAPELLERTEEIIQEAISKEENFFSGIIHYDEQWVFINGEQYYRLQKMDAISHYPYPSKIVHHTEFTPEIIKEYLLENTNNVALDTIITDGNLAYPNIIKELGADHSPCHFHFIDKYLKKYWAEQRKLNNKIKTNENKIEVLNNKITRTKNTLKKETQDKKIKAKLQEKNKKRGIELKILKQENKTLKKKIKANEKVKKSILLLLNSKTIKTANKRLKKLKSNIQDYNKIFQDCIRKIEENWEKLTIPIKNRLIPRTNNNIELYFRVTIPKACKKIYRSIEGFQRRDEIERQKWIQRNTKLNLT